MNSGTSRSSGPSSSSRPGRAVDAPPTSTAPAPLRVLARLVVHPGGLVPRPLDQTLRLICGGGRPALLLGALLQPEPFHLLPRLGKRELGPVASVRQGPRRLVAHPLGVRVKG